MKLNEYLLQNPQAVEGVFTKIFGKYMLRYYNNDGYTVQFDPYAETSYQDANNKRIVISLDNVISQLQKGVHVLAVAYHELAHTLYTNNNHRDKIRRKALDHVRDYLLDGGNTPHNIINYVLNYVASDRLHAIWNVIEDNRIEQKLMSEFEFLRDIVSPLRTLIDPNGDPLFEWRVTDKTSNQVVQENADGFLLKKKQSQIQLARYIANIYIELYLNDDLDAVKNAQENGNSSADELQETKGQQMQDQASNKPTKQQRDDDIRKRSLEDDIDEIDNDIETVEGAIDEKQQEIDDIEQKDESERTSSDEYEYDNAKKYIESANDYIEEQEKRKQKLKEEYQKQFGKDYKKKSKLDSARERLQEIKSIDTQDSSEQAIKSILETIQNTIIENQELQSYEDSVINYDKNYKPWMPESDKIHKVYNPKQVLRNGMTAAQQKRYSMNITNKVNVGRIVNSKANRTAPQVFYGRGKDISFTKKVVIFEDVSSSTRPFTHMFSSIAWSLANAYDSVEWWGYAEYLYLKDTKHYDINTRTIGKENSLHVGGTDASRLLNVMKKYKNKDYTYIIITDGDMKSIFEDKDTWEYFKDKTAVLGFLDKEIQANCPHHVNILHDIAKANGYTPQPSDDIYDVFTKAKVTEQFFRTTSKYYPIITKGVNGAMDLVRSRLK